MMTNDQEGSASDRPGIGPGSARVNPPRSDAADPIRATIWSGIYVEWDEPGAGALCKDGKRLIHFSIDTDWSDTWNPQVNEVGLALIDQFPRMQQEVDMALETAKRYEAEARDLAATNGSSPHQNGSHE